MIKEDLQKVGFKNISCQNIIPCFLSSDQFLLFLIFKYSIYIGMIVLNSRKMVCKVYMPPKPKLYPVKLTKMHWYGYNNTVPLSNTKKNRLYCPGGM